MRPHCIQPYHENQKKRKFVFLSTIGPSRYCRLVTKMSLDVKNFEDVAHDRASGLIIRNSFVIFEGEILVNLTSLPSAQAVPQEVYREDFSDYVAHLQLHMALHSRKLTRPLVQGGDSCDKLLQQTQATLEKQASRQV
jgi:hypothetical protein